MQNREFNDRELGNLESFKRMVRLLDLKRRSYFVKNCPKFPVRITTVQFNHLMLLRFALPCNLSRVMAVTGLTSAGASLFVEKLVTSLERSRKRGYEASMLWFGNRVTIAVTDVELSEKDTFVAKFNVMGSPLPVPVDEQLRDLIKYAVVKDRQLVKSFGRNKSGIHEWRYYGATMIF